MKLFFKRLSVYWLCFFVCYLPYRQVQAAIPLAAVVLDVVAGSAIAIAADTIVTKAICGKKPWGANDPVFACNSKTSKSNWSSKAKTTGKWMALLAAAGFIIDGGVYYSNSAQSCSYGHFSSNSLGDCYSKGYAELDSYIASQNAIYKGEPIYTSLPDVNVSGSQVYLRYKYTYSDNRTFTGQVGPIKTSGYTRTELEDSELFNDFWKTSPDVPATTWLPEPTTDVPNPVHPDPEWFPNSDPVTTPYVPSPSYPQTLPDTHPDKRPASDPKPDYGDFPFDLPGSWPSDWPEPGTVPVSPGDFPLEWPLPGSTPLPDPTPTPDPTPDPDKPTDPDIPVDPSPLPNPLPVIGPLTRTEFEQVQAKNFSEATTNLPDPNFQKHQDEITKAMNDFIADSVDVVVPEFGFNPFGYFSYGGGSCIAFSFNLSIGGKTKNVTFDSHCPPFEDYVRPTLEWSLYLSTGLYLYMMFTRTVRSL